MRHCPLCLLQLPFPLNWNRVLQINATFWERRTSESCISYKHPLGNWPQLSLYSFFSHPSFCYLYDEGTRPHQGHSVLIYPFNALQLYGQAAYGGELWFHNPESWYQYAYLCPLPFISFKCYLFFRLIEGGTKEDGSQEWTTVCNSCWTENGNSKSSKLLLSFLYYHMCAISMKWHHPPIHTHTNTRTPWIKWGLLILQHSISS